MNYIIPPINTKGMFELASPFNNVLSSLEEYTVTAIRTLNEISADDPLNNIYIPVGLTIDDMNDDIANEVPITVLVATGGEYIYVPCNRLRTIPLINGSKHQEKVLTIPLGLLPLDFNFDLIKTSVEELIYDLTANKSESVIYDSSRIVLLSETETKKLELYRDNIRKINKSYRTRYEEISKILENRDKQIAGLEAYVKKNK